MFNKVVFILFKAICRIKGYYIVRANRQEHFEDVFCLRNEVYFNEGMIKAPMPKEDKALQPDGMAHCFIVYFKKNAVGTVFLFDLSKTDSYNALIFEKEFKNLDSLNRTYEMRRLAVRRNHQGKGSLVFLALLQNCLVYSYKDGIKEWLVGTKRDLYYSIRRLNKNITIISKQANSTNPALKEEAALMNPTFFEDVICYKVDIEKIDIWNIFKGFVKNYKFGVEFDDDDIDNLTSKVGDTVDLILKTYHSPKK